MENAKGIVLHLTYRAAHCHRCDDRLSGDAEVVCGKCRALNLDW